MLNACAQVYDAVEWKVKLTVNKADPTVTNAPTAKELTYTGDFQDLLNQGRHNGICS